MQINKSLVPKNFSVRYRLCRDKETVLIMPHKKHEMLGSKKQVGLLTGILASMQHAVKIMGSDDTELVTSN